MTKKDGDKLREMKAELMRMADDYRPIGYQPNQVYESDSMGELATGIQSLLEGKHVMVVISR